MSDEFAEDLTPGYHYTGLIRDKHSRDGVYEKRIARWRKLGSWTRVVTTEVSPLTILRFATGWKAVPFIAEDVVGTHRAYIFALHSARSLDEACKDLIARELLIDHQEIYLLECEWGYYS